MKKRIVLFFCVALVLLALPIGFIFAGEECEHIIIDDNDCSTPVICSKCEKTVVAAKEHDFSTVISYELPKDANGKDDFFSEGIKHVKCSNEKCSFKSTISVQPFVSTLGYAIKEDTFEVTNKDGSISEKTEATIISTFLFNTTEIEEYAKLNGNKLSFGTFIYKKFDLVKGVVCGNCEFLYDNMITVGVEQDDGSIEYERVKTQWKDVPETYKCPQCNADKSSFYLVNESPLDIKTGKFNKNIYFPNNGEIGRITDLSIMKIDESNYNAELVIAAYLIIDNDLYYVQNNKIFEDYNELVSVTCDKILDELNQK